MSRFVFLTRTHWDEPPRLRHQLAILLANAGHDVLFFEKPRYPWLASAAPRRPHPRIELHQQRELIHHRLRFNFVLRGVNAYWAKRALRSSVEQLRINTGDVIVNFNYDYYFLRDLFPPNRIITVINDDFIDRSLLGYSAPFERTLARTASISDHVLTVSEPLQRQLAHYCTPVLFEPWADRAYQKPERGTQRDTLLYWGYIDWRMDYQLVRDLAARLAVERPGIKLLFVGPIQSRCTPDVDTLRGMSNIVISPAASLDEIASVRILAALIPYRSGVPSIVAIANPNRALQTLARGLPLMIAGMPHFFEAPFVTRVNVEEIGRQIDSVQANFEAIQPAIEEFVSCNGPEARLRQIMRLLN